MRSKFINGAIGIILLMMTVAFAWATAMSPPTVTDIASSATFMNDKADNGAIPTQVSGTISSYSIVGAGGSGTVNDQANGFGSLDAFTTEGCVAATMTTIPVALQGGVITGVTDQQNVKFDNTVLADGIPKFAIWGVDKYDMAPNDGTYVNMVGAADYPTRGITLASTSGDILKVMINDSVGLCAGVTTFDRVTFDRTSCRSDLAATLTNGNASKQFISFGLQVRSSEKNAMTSGRWNTFSASSATFSASTH